ncbi:MAG: T9SS type A sorting domain-containing protein [Flavipsychrobacter sp.]
MKKIFLLLALASLGQNVIAQSALQSENDPNRYWGHFDVIKMTSKGEEHINVNYNLTPKPVGNTLNVNLNTPNPMALSIKVTDASGRTKLSWKPDQASTDYNKQFNLSNLAGGMYVVNVYDANNNKVYSIPFSKQ